MLIPHGFLIFYAVHILRLSPVDGQKVVIVGGGVSGLSAAYHLCLNKLCDVTILEAENRVGGRLFTDRFKGEIIERGAQWMHGSKGNPVYSLVSRNYSVIVDEWTEGGTYKLSSGAKSDETTPGLLLMAEELWDELNEKLSAMAKPSTQKYKALIDEAKKLWDAKLVSRNITSPRTKTDAIFHYTMTEWSLETGELSHNVSALAVLYFRYLEGGDITIPQGYSVLLDILQKGIPKSAIKLGRRVTKILWDSSKSTAGDENNLSTSQVNVEYTNSDGSTGMISADHVIVTVSIGVLQKSHQLMFSPKFSRQRARAVGKIKLGIVNKLFLYYENKFWKDTDFPMRLLWDSNVASEFKEDAHWYREVDLIETYGENMLLVWANAEVSREALDLSNEELGRRLTVLFRRFMGNDSIPYPDDLTVTRWHKNDNFLGSYSYISFGQSKVTKRIAMRPLVTNGLPRVFFAGEAMHLTRFGTIDGAFRTGKREATRIIELYPL